jgi:hypothetical protein
MGVMMEDAPTVRAPTVVAASRRPIMQGPVPPLFGHHRWPGDSLSCADSCLGLLLCCGADLCLLIGVRPCLHCMRRSLICKSSSLLRRGSWIAEMVPSLCGRKDWQPLCARSGRQTQNVMLVALERMPSSRTFPLKCAPLVPGPGSSPTLAEC